MSGCQEQGGENEGCLLHGFFGGDGNILELVVMVAQCHECPKSHRIVHFKMVEMVNFMLYPFHLNNKKM